MPHSALLLKSVLGLALLVRYRQVKVYIGSVLNAILDSYIRFSGLFHSNTVVVNTRISERT